MGTSLQWEASQDRDSGDTLSYKVFLGLDPDPTEVIVMSTNNLTIDLPTNLTAATIYYWKVTTNDSFGNEIESQIFSFSTP